MNTSNTSFVRLNITLPKSTVEALESEVPKRGKSQFIAEAIEEKITREKREEAFERLAKLPPTFIDIKDSSAYISTMRKKEDAQRRKKLGI